MRVHFIERNRQERMYKLKKNKKKKNICLQTREQILKIFQGFKCFGSYLQLLSR